MPLSSTQLQRQRTQSLVLINKLLGQRDNASPFTVITDSLEQSSEPVVREFIRRAKVAKTRVVFIAFETLKRPRDVDVFVPAARTLLKQPEKLLDEITAHLSTAATGSTSTSTRTLFIIDSLHPLLSTPCPPLPVPALPDFLSALLARPNTSLVAAIHSDVPLTVSTTISGSHNPYAPSAATLLTYLATTIITPHSATHILNAKAAANRSQQPPAHGLGEEREGVIAGLGRNGGGRGAGVDAAGHLGGKGGGKGSAVMMEVEHRRKSGRAVKEWYVLDHRGASSTSINGKAATSTGRGKPARGGETSAVMLLEDYPPYQQLNNAPSFGQADEGEGGGGDGVGQGESTFNLGLTEKQRRDREGVVLPYFDAQKGGGEGGRILYQMGEEDDFDEEEDEI